MRPAVVFSSGEQNFDAGGNEYQGGEKGNFFTKDWLKTILERDYGEKIQPAGDCIRLSEPDASFWSGQRSSGLSKKIK